MKTRYYCLGVALLSVLIGCNSGGSENEEIVPQLETESLSFSDIVGIYMLISFTVEFPDGQIVTEEDVSTFSGMFSILPNISRQRITINGLTVRIQAEIALVGDDTLSVMDIDNGCKRRLEFSLENGVLTTFVSMDGAQRCGGEQFSETDVWERIE